MKSDVQAPGFPLPLLGDRTMTVWPKYPWDMPVDHLELFTLFRAHVGEPTDPEEPDPLEVATDVALDRVCALGRLASWMTFVRDSFRSLPDERRLESAPRIVADMEATLEVLLPALITNNQKHLSPETVGRFTMTPPERVRIFGRVYDSAHAAAVDAIPGVADTWKMARQLVDDLEPGPAAVAVPEVFVEALRQLESTPYDELLRQVAREHLMLRERRALAEGPEGPPDQRGSTAPAWSGAQTKKVLADFFAVDVRLLERELRERGVAHKKCSRQGYRIDLNTLDASRREEFLEKLERR